MKEYSITAWTLGIFLLLVAGPSAAASADWQHLNPREKEKIQRNYQRWEKLAPQDKEHLRDQWDRWQRLPQDERDRLKQRYNDQRRRERNN